MPEPSERPSGRRAKPLPPEDRRRALIDVTVPLLLEHGRRTTTRQVADAAGIAEGTIFRVFDSKDALFQATLEHAFDIQPLLDDLALVDRSLPLRERLLAIATILQVRFSAIFAMMAAMGLMAPPVAKRHSAEGRREAAGLMVALVESERDQMRCEPAELMHTLRLLTFSASHPHISDGIPLTPQQIVNTVCDGLLLTEPGAPTC